MKTNIKATNLELTAEIKKAIEEKIGDLDRFLPDAKTPLEAYIEVARETRHHQKGEIFYAEVNLKIIGEVIRAEAREDNIFKAIGSLRNAIQELLGKYKKKQIAKREKAARIVKEKGNTISA
jgi:ribosomal subunit interface protein